MKTNTTFEVTSDITALMERDGANYTGNLVVRSEKLDDYDVYRLNADGLWDCEFDSLTNRAEGLDLPEGVEEFTNWLWNLPEFVAWAESMKSLVPVTEEA